MKKTLIILSLVTCVAVTAKSQISTEKAKQAVSNTKQTSTATAVSATSAVPQTGMDVNSTASGIMGKLNSALALTKAQKPKVLAEVTSFLKDKSGILGLATTDKAQYTKKLSDLTSGLSTKLKGILTTTQFKKFLSLKPTKANAKNVLSQLFY